MKNEESTVAGRREKVEQATFALKGLKRSLCYGLCPYRAVIDKRLSQGVALGW